MQPAIVPRRETLKSARTSASPNVSSVCTGDEHADECLLDLVRELIDDAVGADIHAFAIGKGASLGARANVEADHERIRRRRKVDVVLGDAADTRVDHVDAHLGVLDLSELAEQCLDGSLNIALEDDVEVLHDALLELREEALERDAALRALRELLPSETPRPLLGDVLCEALVLDNAREFACGRRAIEAEDLDRLTRARLSSPSRPCSRRAP